MPRAIWILGFVSLLMDISSELIHSLLPMFMLTTLGMSVFTIGLIEGIAESTALVVKVFSGALSDYWGKRKGLAVLGYGLGALTKPLFALATGSGLVVTARFLDRIGKGIRGAPRDALVADIAPPGLRGAAFGLRQSLDTVGAFLGPVIATLLMVLWANDFRAVFWAACLPAGLCVLLLVVGVKEPECNAHREPINPISRAALASLGRHYWWVVGLGALFTLARFSEAFLILRAEQIGIPMALVPLVMVAMNLVYAASALWGIHMGMTQGLLATMVADTAPAALRGTAFGFFNLMSGVAMLVSSGLAGLLWDNFGSSTTFFAGAGFCFLTLFGLLVRQVNAQVA